MYKLPIGIDVVCIEKTPNILPANTRVAGTIIGSFGNPYYMIALFAPRNGTAVLHVHSSDLTQITKETHPEYYI